MFKYILYFINFNSLNTYQLKFLKFNLGRTFCNEETFGQYPLQVNGFSTIHESLEAAMTQEIESSDVMTKSGQEVLYLDYFICILQSNFSMF